jgi:exosortase
VSTADVADVIVENREAKVAPRVSRWSVGFSIALTAVVIASHLPLVVLHFRHLWMNRPHYQFFPLLLVAIAWLVWQRWPRWTVPVRAPWWSTCLLAGGLAVLAGATVIWSPWLAAIALVLSLGGLIGRYAVPGQWRDWLPVWLVMWLIVPPPFRWDFRLIFWLQTSTSQMASYLLDLLNILHLMEGHVLVLPGHRMLVDEACSGVNSVLVLLVLTALFVVGTRRPLVWSALLLLSSVAWAWAANVVRITTIAIAQAWYQVDLSTGWRHELLGYITISMALIWLISTDFCLSFLLRPIILRHVDLSELALGPSPLSRAWNWFVGASARMYSEFVPPDSDDSSVSDPNGQPRKSPASGRDERLSEPVVIRPGAYAWLGAFGLFGFLQLGSFLVPEERGEIQIVRFESEDIPETLDGWSLIEYQPDERVLQERFSLYSDEWVYGRGPLAVRVSIDYPFTGWHELTVCYRGSGWQLKNRQSFRGQDGSDADGPYVEASLTRPTGEHGWLLFGLFDQTGKPLAPVGAPEDHWPSFLEKLARSPLAYWLLDLRHERVTETTYQLQLFASGTVDLTSEQKDEVRRFFQSVRSQVVEAYRRKASN